MHVLYVVVVRHLSIMTLSVSLMETDDQFDLCSIQNWGNLPCSLLLSLMNSVQYCITFCAQIYHIRIPILHACICMAILMVDVHVCVYMYIYASVSILDVFVCVIMSMLHYCPFLITVLHYSPRIILVAAPRLTRPMLLSRSTGTICSCIAWRSLHGYVCHK